MSSLHYSFFRKGRNFFYSSALFPRAVRDEVAVLYSFVRYVDDLVDRSEPLVEDFYRAYRLLERSLDGAVSPRSSASSPGWRGGGALRGAG